MTAQPLIALSRLALARARRRPGRWLLAVAGIAVTTAFAGGILAQSTITADAGARSVLRGLGPLDGAVRVTWSGVVTPTVERRAGAALSGLDLSNRSEAVLMNPVRLDGVVVKPAAISPLRSWVAPGPWPGAALDRCRPAACPVLLTGGAVGRDVLGTDGVRLVIAGRTSLRSAVPLGFRPQDAAGTGQPPLLLTGDARGLEALSGLDSLYRTHSWVGSLPVSKLHSWDLAGVEMRLRQIENRLLADDSGFAMTAPFSGLDAARAQASAAPRRLLLTGGGVLAALVLFVLLAAGSLRRDQLLELERLRSAGARPGQGAAFLLIDSGLLCGLGVLLGAALGAGSTVLLAAARGAPAGGVLEHALLTPAWPAALVGWWIGATLLIASSALLRTSRVADVAALAAVAALSLALVLDPGGGGTLAVLVAPICALAGGVLVYRGAAALLRLAERLSRRGPVLTRLALVGLARSPSAPALAISFIAVSTGLAGFALCYRATLLRGTSDQAADQVPLDRIIAPGRSFARPLELATRARWQALTGGAIWPVRRTEASYVAGGSSVTVPALGVPAPALARIHGWRTSDGSAPLTILTRRLVRPGPTRIPGPMLGSAQSATTLSLHASARGSALGVIADLRGRDGTIRRLSLGRAESQPRLLRARVPRGTWELEALELREPVGLELTNGHQNGENPAAATQFTARVHLSAPGRIGLSLERWRGVGAARTVTARGREIVVSFAETGEPGVLRPPQPSDIRPVPVLADPAVPRGRVALTVDGVPVQAQVVGTLRRFPTLPPSSAGFVVADEQTLASALDAEDPGQGAADELWQAGGRDVRPYPEVTYASRLEVQRQLREAPLPSGVLGTLIAGAALAGLLSVIGLLVSLLGSVRDRRIEDDLLAQGIGPRGLRRELRLRLGIAGALGVLAGVAIAGGLTVLAVASVRAGAGASLPRPPLVTVAPWGDLVLGAAAMLAALGAAGWGATQR